MMNKRMIFLLSTERSGSNLLTKILDAHSEINGPTTKHLLNPLLRNYYRYMPFTRASWRDLVRDLFHLYQVDFSKWQLEPTEAELMKDVPEGDVAELARWFFDRERELNNKSYSFIKELRVYEFYPFIKKHFPNATFLYLIRDPRDVAISWKKSKIHPGGLIQASKEWKVDQQQYLKIKALEEDNLVTVRYEDLISHPEKVLSSFLARIGLEWEVQMNDFHEASLTGENASKQAAWENTSRAIISDNSKKYKRELKDSEIKLIEKVVFYEMVKCGYSSEFQESVLQRISDTDVLQFKQIEESEISLSLTDGVRKNMEAKKRFYQYIHNYNDKP